MEKLDNILRMWETDSAVDKTEPSSELTRVPQLHSKYLNILTSHKIAAKKAFFDLQRMKKVKWEYYTGKMDKETLDQYGWEPFQFTLKSDVSTYMDADEDMIKLNEKKVYHDEVVSVVEYIMNELKSRTFQLRDIISWEKFIGGQ